MFEFIKSLFRKKPAKPESTDPVLVHVDIGESIVITEVALASVKPTLRKTKVTQLKEVKPVVDANKVKPAPTNSAKPKASKTKPSKSKPAKIVQLVQPIPAKKKGRPKKDTTV